MLYLAQVFVFRGFLKTSHSALNGQVIRGRIFQRHNPQSSIENCLKSTKNSPNTSFSNVFVLPTTVRWFLYRKYTFVHLTLSILNFLIQIIILRKWFRTKQRNPNMTTEKGAYLFLVTKRWQQDNRDTQPNPIPATYSTWDGVFGLFLCLFVFVDEEGTLSSLQSQVWCCPAGQKTPDRQFSSQPHMSNSTNAQLCKHYHGKLGIISMGYFCTFENPVGASAHFDPKIQALFNVICRWTIYMDLNGGALTWL